MHGPFGAMDSGKSDANCVGGRRILDIKLLHGTGARMPTVSVVIPCFNQGRFLAESIASACLAYSGPLEIIVVDDGSTEKKAERWLREVEASFPNVNVIRQANQGLSGARNSGINAATGEFIQLLDADDLLVPGKLDLQVAHFKLSPFLDVSISDFLLCDANRSEFFATEHAIANFELGLEDFLYRWERGLSIPIHCALFRRRLLGTSPFSLELVAKEDWVFWCRLAVNGAHMAYLRANLAIYRQHGGSMRRSVLNMSKNWMKAALQIDQLVSKRYPGFLDTSISWLQEYYRSHPSYIDELKSLNAASNGSIAEMQTGVSKSPDLTMERLVSKLKTLESYSTESLLTVVVPIFNHYEYLLTCLESLYNQSNQDFEIVCIDDASDDVRVGKFLDLLASTGIRIRIIRNKSNLGISATQNVAVAAARGQFVAFLDCDDLLENNAIAEVTKEIRAHPDVDYFFTDRCDIDEQDSIVRIAQYGGYPNIKPGLNSDIRDDLIDGMVASHLKVIRRSHYLSVGGSTDKYAGCQDWELALKIARVGKFHYIPKALYRHRLHAKSVTSSERVAQFRKTNELRRIYCRERLNSQLQSEIIEPANVQELDEKNTIVFTQDRDLPLISDLKHLRSKGIICEFDTRGRFSLGYINFLREYNSFFDRLIWDDPAVPGALLGYLWSDSILARLE